jgi:hypothetical protein
MNILLVALLAPALVIPVMAFTARAIERARRGEAASQ